jgi:4-hydroxy-tetrahydrodipicolinate reductase
MAQPIPLAIAGAGGRMGQRLIALAAAAPEKWTLVAALDRPNSPRLGKPTPAAGVAYRSDLTDAQPRVVIDFSTPEATRALLAHCVERRIALVIGTTGLTREDHAAIDRAANAIAILQANNTSLGVNVLLGLAAQAARQLGDAYDIEIVEAHHNQKKDAPSGTALAIANAITDATGRDIEKDLVHGRKGGDAKRERGTIGMHAVRMGDVVGEHTVFFATQGERIELRHIATTRDTFAQGALVAAAFLVNQPAGRYTMADVLGLPTK